MNISALSSTPALAQPVSLPRENEATERKPDNNEANEPVAQQLSLKEGQGNKLDIKA